MEWYLGVGLSLKSLAELLGCEYAKVSERTERRVVNYVAAVCDVDTVVELVTQLHPHL